MNDYFKILIYLRTIVPIRYTFNYQNNYLSKYLLYIPQNLAQEEIFIKLLHQTLW